MGAHVSFEERLVLFVDFLGFSELANDAAIRNDPMPIVDAVDLLRGIESERSYSKRVTQFSDSLVVSFRVDERSALFHLLNEIRIYLVCLTGSGFLVRGGVALGKLVHTDDYLFGPAMNEAYRLENEVAKNPRVLVGDDILNVARAFPAYHHSSDDELSYVEDLLSTDPEDGLKFVDFLSFDALASSTDGEGTDWQGYVEILERLISNGLKHSKESVTQKYIWLEARFSEAKSRGPS